MTLEDVLFRALGSKTIMALPGAAGLAKWVYYAPQLDFSNKQNMMFTATHIITGILAGYMGIQSARRVKKSIDEGISPESLDSVVVINSEKQINKDLLLFLLKKIGYEMKESFTNRIDPGKVQLEKEHNLQYPTIKNYHQIFSRLIRTKNYDEAFEFIFHNKPPVAYNLSSITNLVPNAYKKYQQLFSIGNTLLKRNSKRISPKDMSMSDYNIENSMNLIFEYLMIKRLDKADETWLKLLSTEERDPRLWLSHVKYLHQTKRPDESYSSLNNGMILILSDSDNWPLSTPRASKYNTYVAKGNGLSKLVFIKEVKDLKHVDSHMKMSKEGYGKVMKGVGVALPLGGMHNQYLNRDGIISKYKPDLAEWLYIMEMDRGVDVGELMIEEDSQAPKLVSKIMRYIARAHVRLDDLIPELKEVPVLKYYDVLKKRLDRLPTEFGKLGQEMVSAMGPLIERLNLGPHVPNTDSHPFNFRRTLEGNLIRTDTEMPTYRINRFIDISNMTAYGPDWAYSEENLKEYNKEFLKLQKKKYERIPSEFTKYPLEIEAGVGLIYRALTNYGYMTKKIGEGNEEFVPFRLSFLNAGKDASLKLSKKDDTRIIHQYRFLADAFFRLIGYHSKVS